MSVVPIKKKKFSYLKEVQNELKKVTWTSKEELILATKTVIFTTIFFGLAIYGVDLLIRSVLDLTAHLFRMVAG